MTGHSVKLITEHGKTVEGVEQWFSDHPGHFVVGILGGQGVGKSSLLSSFCQKPNTFTKQPPSMAAVAGYQTSGIDMYITSERMILLDTEPLFCMSNLENALRNERITEGVPPDMWLDHQALVMTTFLLSVCNVVMIVVDENSHWMGTTKVFKLLQRCELMMKALSLSNSGSTVGAGGGVAGGGGGAMGVHATPQEGLGDWCADIVLVSNKVPVMKFGVGHYQHRAQELANLFQHSGLQMFASINMPTIYTRFEDAFKSGTATSTISAAKLTDSAVANNSSASPDNQATTPSLKAKTDQTDDTAAATAVAPDEPVQDSTLATTINERKSAQFLNFVTLPFDSTLTPVSQNTQQHHRPTLSSSSSSSSVPPLSTSLSSLSSLSLSSLTSSSSTISPSPFSALNRAQVFGSVHADHDVFAKTVQDQERSRVWNQGLRNKILSLSMRPQGGPALGPRMRPGMVSEREWLRYMVRKWDAVRKAEFLGEYVRAGKLSRDG
ncbi:smg-9, nonsense mediated mRNA decay factor [Podila minutissima]|nr:smg-9, nonsense mediated mRNA decay factor [Podila minutissima]